MVKAQQDRRRQAMQMRIAGASPQDILRAGIGYRNLSLVYKDLKKSLADFYVEDPTEILTLDLSRIDEMQLICTASLRAGNTSEVRNIMALMEARRQILGITPETVKERQLEKSQMVNNGIMVVQGTTGEYLEGLMRAAGVPEEVRKSEVGKLALEAGRETIPGEVVGTPETPGESRKVRLRKPGKPSRNAPEGQEPRTATERGARSLAGTGTGGTAQRAGEGPLRGSTGHHDSLADLEDRLEARVRELDQRLDAQPGIGDMSSPAVVPQELALPRRKVLRIPVKSPDANLPAGPGVVYRNPPRKPGNPGSSLGYEDVDLAYTEHEILD